MKNNFLNRKKLFIRFLKENHIYNSFKYNLEKQYKYDRYYDINGIIKNNIKVKQQMGNEFSIAFSWDNSKEGYTFWQNFAHKWNLFVIYNCYNTN